MDDTNEPAQAQPESEGEQRPGFLAENWQILIGLKTTADGKGVHFGLEGDPSIFVPVAGNPRESMPDISLRAVHFADWLQRNMRHLLEVSEREYAQHCNLQTLKLAEEERRNKPVLKLIAPDGSGRLQ